MNQYHVLSLLKVNNYPLSQGFARRGAKRPPEQFLHSSFISLTDRRLLSAAEM